MDILMALLQWRNRRDKPGKICWDMPRNRWENMGTKSVIEVLLVGEIMS
jgi:hypothetical protein